MNDELHFRADASSCTVSALYSLEHTIAADVFSGKTYPWEILDDIKTFILRLGHDLSPDDYDNPSEGVWIAKDAVVAPTAFIGAPCIIDRGAEIRHCAFIRECAIVGKGAVVGNSTELKNVILFDGVQVPHYNYVGDSVLGWLSHMGAGAVTSNVKSDKSDVIIKTADRKIATGRMKVGAMLGDNVEIGCNSVLNPGTVVCPGSSIYPSSCVRGTVPAGCIYKTGGIIVRRVTECVP